MKKLILLLFCLLGCVNAELGRRPAWEVRVGAEAGWDYTHQRWIESSIASLNQLGGPTFKLASGRVDVTIRLWRATNCTQMAGFYMPGTSEVHLDPHCAVDEMEFRTLTQHELGHFMGMVHICRTPHERDVCSTVGFGEAMMNPNTVLDTMYDASGRSFIHRTPYEPTWLDRLEFWRATRARTP